MAIRQERMISLINAAVAYRELAYMASRRLIELERMINQLSQTELINQMISLSSHLSHALVEATRHDVCISMERAKFAKNWKANEKAKDKMAQQRRKDNKKLLGRVEYLNETGKIEYTAHEQGTTYLPIDGYDIDKVSRTQIQKQSTEEFSDNPEDLPPDVRELYYQQHPEARPKPTTDLEQEIQDIAELRKNKNQPRTPLNTYDANALGEDDDE